MSLRPVSLFLLLALLVSSFASISLQAATEEGSVAQTTEALAAPALPQEEAAPVASTAPSPSQSIILREVSSYSLGVFYDEDDEVVPTAEIVAHDPTSQRLFVTSSFSDTIEILDVSNPTNPTAAGSISLGGSPNSVAVYDGTVAVAVEADPAQDPGTVEFYDTSGSSLGSVTVGALPDMVTFTPNGEYVLVANEGEPSDDYSIDPPGSISIIDVSGGFSSPTVTTAGFDNFELNEELQDTSVRIYPTESVTQSLEPEYIAVSPDSQTAFVTLQENNAVAVVDITSLDVAGIVGLGFKDFLMEENAFDASNRDGVDGDGAINIRNWPVKGMFQPDAIATFQADGNTYLITANEGDARDYDGYSEEFRVEDITLDESFLNDNPNIQDEDQLGRLRITTDTVMISGTTPVSGDIDLDGDFDELYAYGARSFSIWDSTGNLVYDSGDDFARIIERDYPAFFNSNYSANPDGDDEFEFDDRSDDKGAEPEGVTTGVVDGVPYGFILLERMGGIMTYDLSDPTAPTFVGYTNTANFGEGINVEDGSAGNISPEGVIFVEAGDSPTGNPLVVVAYEISGTVAIFEIAEPNLLYLPFVAESVSGSTLTLLHNNDGESTLLPLENGVSPANGWPISNTITLTNSGVAAFKSVMDREIADARARGNSVLSVYAGDAFLASATLTCSLDDPNIDVYDAVAQRQMPYDAHVIGNHEFDYGPEFLERFISDFDDGNGLDQPFLGANLDFSGEPIFDNLVDSDGLLLDPITDGRVVGEAVIVTDEVTGEQFGVVGIAPYYLANISSPGDVTLEETDLDGTVDIIQTQVDRLTGNGVNKIIVVSHLQDINEDITAAGDLSDVDVMVAGGGDELLVNPLVNQADQFLPGEAAPIQNTYPVEVQDADGETVYIVTTAGNYKYLGRMDVVFDADGEVVRFDTDTSYPRRVIPDTAENASAIDALGIMDAVEPDANIESSVITPLQQCLDELADPIIGTDVVLDVSRAGVRTSETNSGNLITDSYIDMYNEYADDNGLDPISPTNPLIAIQNGGGIRQNAGDVLPQDGTAPGTISRLETKNVLAFFNTMTVVEDVTPSDLKAIFERAASELPSAGGQFLQVAGLTVGYDTSNQAQVIAEDGTVTTPGTRVVSMTLQLSDNTTVDVVTNGTVNTSAPSVDIVTNSFTADGGDNYPWLEDNTNKTVIFDDQGVIITYEEAWVDYMLSFPTSTINSETLPTIPADPPYQNGANERIFITTGP
jgi:2',3'-cyclic-nucleotide 2'-phosphodiesterase (5'-nucleotidase family)